MLDDIRSQPDLAESILQVYFRFGSYQLSLPLLGQVESRMAKVKQVLFLGCGTSYHAGLYGQYLFRDTAGMPAYCEFADEFAGQKSLVGPETLVIGLSQSGETGDLKTAMRQAGRAGAVTLALVNQRGSSLEKMCEGALYLEAGEEKALPATKSYLAELVLVYLLMLRVMELQTGKTSPLRLRKAVWELPESLQGALKTDKYLKQVARTYAKYKRFPVLGERFGYPAALEGALKIAETSYLSAHGYPTGELRHGPIATIGRNEPAIFLFSASDKWESTDQVVEAVKKAKGKTIVLTDRQEIKDLSADKFIYLPHIHETMFPMIAAVPLQYLAYYLALEMGADVDKPRHLHKYVA